MHPSFTFAGTLLALVFSAGLMSAAVGAVNRDAEFRVWTDTQTGIAIGGYDPVAYYVDGVPRPGNPRHEGIWQGQTWRFVNEGNKAAFLEAPHVYAPRFGGYSPIGVARGVAIPGNPLLFAIRDDRLYLFYSPAHQQIWNENADGVMRAAENTWPALSVKTAR